MSRFRLRILNPLMMMLLAAIASGCALRQETDGAPVATNNAEAVTTKAGESDNPIDVALGNALFLGIAPSLELGAAAMEARLRTGRWPRTADDLGPSDRDWSRFEGLSFDPQPDGGCVIVFDRWVSPDGKARANHGTITISHPAEEAPLPPTP